MYHVINPLLSYAIHPPAHQALFRGFRTYKYMVVRLVIPVCLRKLATGAIFYIQHIKDIIGGSNMLRQTASTHHACTNKF